MVDRMQLRLSATLLIVGLLLVTIVTLYLHPGGGATFEATFANYAASGSWAAIHLAQFVFTAMILAGLLVLFFALDVTEGAPRWVALFAAVTAAVAIALTAVLYAVDGVALKQAVNAWASAPAAEKATRFANAQTIRWMEFGANSYQNITTGLALVLFGIAVAWTARVSRPIGYLMGVSGLAFIALGWLVGTNGFTSANLLPQNLAYGLLFVSTIWLLVIAWRMKEVGQPRPA
jgi:hypothetical protein